MRVAPASKLFSTSSLTTDAGRSTTSPAAIWLANRAGSISILIVFLTRKLTSFEEYQALDQ